MLQSESHSDVKPCARGRIFLRVESLRDSGHAGPAAAFWVCASACIASGACASVGDWHCRRALRPRIFRGQDSLRRYDLGFYSHVYSAARRCTAGVRSRRKRGSGVALGRRAPCGWRGADFAWNESERTGCCQCEPGTVQQLDTKFGGGRARGLAVLAGQRASSCNHHCGRCTFGRLRVFALPLIPLRAAVNPEVIG